MSSLQRDEVSKILTKLWQCWCVIWLAEWPLSKRLDHFTWIKLIFFPLGTGTCIKKKIGINCIPFISLTVWKTWVLMCTVQAESQIFRMFLQTQFIYIKMHILLLVSNSTLLSKNARKQPSTAKSLTVSLPGCSNISVVLKVKTRSESKDRIIPNRKCHTKDSEDISFILSSCFPEGLVHT